MTRVRRSEILKRVPLSEVKDDLSRYLRNAAEAPIIRETVWRCSR